MTKEEHDLIEKEIFENFYSHARSFNKLSANELNEMELEATLKGDAEMMYITDLIRDLNAQTILNSGL
jgi:hypothetical protein